MPVPKVPRDKMPWFPTINFDACIGDRECVDVCKNSVFDWNDALGQPIVARPYDCVVGCNACAQLCPDEAINFPSKEELKATLRQVISVVINEKVVCAGRIPTGAEVTTWLTNALV